VRSSRALLASLLAAPFLIGAEPRPLALRHVTFDLPGPPVELVPADLNGDGLTDLLVPVVYTQYEENAYERVDGLIHITEVVPALLDRRELRGWLAQPDGTYRMVEPPLALPASVHSVEAGPPGAPAIALTDEGVATVRLRERSGSSGGGAELVLEPLISDPPVLAGSGSYLPGLEMASDLDGDRIPDLMLPARDGPAVYLAAGKGFAPAPASRLTMPGDESRAGGVIRRDYPIPRVEDVDADGHGDLVLENGESGGDDIIVLRGLGSGRFAPPRTIRVGCLGAPDSSGDSDLIFFGDLDGDRRAEGVTSTEKGDDEGLKEAKEPHVDLRFHHLREDLTFDPAPYQEVEVRGYPFGGDFPDFNGSGFRDLDGDGRKDLVTITLDFSVLQIVRVLATKRVGIGLDFHVWAQDAGGRFHEVPGLDLSEKIQVDFNDLKLGRFAQFNGDFDGDGRIDFLHLGRGRTVTIHRGQPGCRYAPKPDLAIELTEEPEDLALVQVRDLDGDGRSDLAVTRPEKPEEPGASAHVKLDLYLSRSLQ
jgi:hypothetical protein